MDWDDLPRLAAMGKDGPDPFTYDDLSRVVESQYTLGVVCATPTGPVGYMVYVVSDGTGKQARKSGRLHLAAGIVRLVVEPAMRRKGVGRFLVDKVGEALVHQFTQRGGRPSAAARHRQRAVARRADVFEGAGVQDAGRQGTRACASFGTEGGWSDCLIGRINEWKDVKATPAGRFDVIMIDAISEIEDGLTEWVQKNPTTSATPPASTPRCRASCGGT
jgi:GNAT superfamily N-acetyltransferase